MSDEHGYCIHGMYVGGCGIDWMCGLCEDGADVVVTIDCFKLVVVDAQGNDTIASTVYSEHGTEYKGWQGLVDLYPANFAIRAGKMSYWTTEKQAEEDGVEWRRPA